MRFSNSTRIWHHGVVPQSTRGVDPLTRGGADDIILAIILLRWSIATDCPYSRVRQHITSLGSLDGGAQWLEREQ